MDLFTVLVSPEMISDVSCMWPLATNSGGDTLPAILAGAP